MSKRAKARQIRNTAPYQAIFKKSGTRVEISGPVRLSCGGDNLKSIPCEMGDMVCSGMLRLAGAAAASASPEHASGFSIGGTF
jgi:hypothetical protein